MYDEGLNTNNITPRDWSKEVDRYELTPDDIDKAVRLFTKAKEVSTDWWVDELDCSKSFRRQKVEGFEFDRAIELYRENAKDCTVTTIHRGGPGEDHYEVGYRLSGKIDEPDIFLWIIVEPEDYGRIKIDE